MLYRISAATRFATCLQLDVFLEREAIQIKLQHKDVLRQQSIFLRTWYKRLTLSSRKRIEETQSIMHGRLLRLIGRAYC